MAKVKSKGTAITAPFNTGKRIETHLSQSIAYDNIPADAVTFVEDICLTGSRYICDPAPTNTDLDVLVYTKTKKFETVLRREDWKSLFLKGRATQGQGEG